MFIASLLFWDRQVVESDFARNMADLQSQDLGLHAFGVIKDMDRQIHNS